jgi:hypothetical protein
VTNECVEYGSFIHNRNFRIYNSLLQKEIENREIREIMLGQTKAQQQFTPKLNIDEWSGMIGV